MCACALLSSSILLAGRGHRACPQRVCDVDGNGRRHVYAVLRWSVRAAARGGSSDSAPATGELSNGLLLLARGASPWRAASASYSLSESPVSRHMDAACTAHASRPDAPIALAPRPPPCASHATGGNTLAPSSSARMSSESTCHRGSGEMVHGGLSEGVRMAHGGLEQGGIEGRGGGLILAHAPRAPLRRARQP